MSWVENSMMWFSDDNGVTWSKVTDHNRTPLQVQVERIETSRRMADGTLRRYTVAKKRTFNVSWAMLPSSNNSVHNGRTGMNTADGGWAGEDIESFHNNTDGEFLVKFRKGEDEFKAIEDGTIEVVTVMISEFSKDVIKRGIVDLWDVALVLEEV